MANSNFLSAKECEFLAEDEVIEIVPNFRHPTLNFINGDFGEFIPDVPIQVPLWLAVSLKKRGKCRIRQWPWMDKDVLGNVLRQEQQDGENFTPLPYHYMEMASLLFSCSADDLQDGDKIRVLLEDIENVRMAKLRRGMNKIAEDANNANIAKSVKLNNIGSLELLVIRGFFTEALNKFYVLSGNQAEDEEKAQGPSTVSGSGPQESRSSTDAQVGGSRRLRRFR